jgi:hypothetical protein
MQVLIHSVYANKKIFYAMLHKKKSNNDVALAVRMTGWICVRHRRDELPGSLLF